VDELNALSMRNDELIAEREQDAVGMNEMEARVEEYRRKYDAVRIELRNLKGASVMPSMARPTVNVGDIGPVKELTQQPHLQCFHQNPYPKITFLPRPTATLPIFTFQPSKRVSTPCSPPHVHLSPPVYCQP
jgi:hypothetical protein